MDRRETHTLVIGAGQAGLAMGYYLKKHRLPFLLLDAHSRVGDSWRKRYDSLVLFTPRTYSSLPGLSLPGDPDGYPCKDEIALYLEQYVEHYQLPVALNTTVEKVTPVVSGFEIKTNQGVYVAKQIVIATGPFQEPFVPPFASDMSEEMIQVHTADYRNSRQLAEGSVMVVGGGNSGAQVAIELADEGREVFLSVGHPMKMIPQTILGKSLFWWFDVVGVSRLKITSKWGQFFSQNDPIIGTTIRTYLKQKKIQLIQRTIRGEGSSLRTADGQQYSVQNIIWATGYRPSYPWLDVPHVLDGKGNPLHQRGVTAFPGFPMVNMGDDREISYSLLLSFLFAHLSVPSRMEKAVNLHPVHYSNR